ncbi:hypothetical protein [Priestia aryabhattai]|uniref:hypothetical protein n=1 Tax=Priestia aryabhattai TaxID=412384 RepID=UPI003983384D
MRNEEEYMSLDDYTGKREGFYPALFLIQSCFHSFKNLRHTIYDAAATDPHDFIALLPQIRIFKVHVFNWKKVFTSIEQSH